jgi:hypothetical protein
LWLFFLPSIRTANYYTSITNPWRKSWSAILGESTWLVLPAVTALTCIIFLIRRSLRAKFPLPLPATFLAVNFLLIAAVMIITELRGTPVLQFFFYASYMIGPLFMASGLIIGGWLESAPRRDAIVVTLMTWLLLLASYSWLGGDFFLAQTHSFVWIAATAAAGFVVWTIWPARRAGLVFLIAWVVVQFLIFVPIPRNGRSEFIRVDRAMDAIYAEAKDRRPRFWYDADEPCGAEFRSVASTYLWGYTLINDKFPAIKDVPLVLMPVEGNVVVITSQNPSALALARRAMATRGLTLRLLSRRPISKGSVGYTLLITEVRKLPSTRPA